MAVTPRRDPAADGFEPVFSRSWGPVATRPSGRILSKLGNLNSEFNLDENVFTSIPSTCAGRTLSLPRKDWDMRYLRPLGNPDIAQNLFRVGRHLLRAAHHRLLRARSFRQWDEVTCAC